MRPEPAAGPTPPIPVPDVTEVLRFTVRYDEATVRGAVAVFMRRRVFATAWFLGAAAVGLGLVVAGLVGSRPSGLLLEAGLFVLALLGATTLMVWRAHLGSSLGRLRRMSEPEAEVVVAASHLAFRSNLGVAEIPYSAFTEVWRSPTFWMLFTALAAFNVLPTGDLDPAQVAALDRRLPTSPRR